MSLQLFRKLEDYRKKENLSIALLCEQIGAHYTTYHRWKNSRQITGPYKRVVAEFLKRNTGSASSQHQNKPKVGISNSSLQSSSDIAVIGMSCHYPGASNIRELWENILARRIQFRRMLDQRLPLSEYYNEDPKFPEKTYLTKAAFLENFEFDWGRLRIPKKTVESTDIAHWLALDIALKTFEDAGYKLNEIPLQNTGVIVGNTLTGEQTRSQTLRLRWPYVQKVFNATMANAGMNIEQRSRLAIQMEEIYKSAFYPITEDSLAGGLANTIAGRICNYMNFKGGGYIVDGACSSSLLAVATAADALKMGHMDLVLAGGVDISLDPFELVGFAKAGALSKDKMFVYDQRASGFLPGEGCGFVLLKRLEDALRDRNYIYAVIKGWGISSDGKGGIMEPSSSGQSFAIGRAYKNVEYRISDVDFVEGHGTGTTKGDRVELEGIATAIDQNISKANQNKRTCGVTSFKSIFGHTKAAAGVGGLIKAILGVNQRVLPPTASCTEPNQVFVDKAKSLYPIIQGEILSPKKIVRAGISSAGFGGINCHVTLESKDAPKEDIKPRVEERALFVHHQETEIFVFSSRTTQHLKKVIQKFKKDLRNVSIAEMADLAALLNNKVKNHFPVKAVIVTNSPEHLYEALLLLEEDIESVVLAEGEMRRIKAEDTVTHIILSNGVKKNRVGFLYPGQGSQRLNMARTLVERFKWARDLIDVSKGHLYECIYRATDKFLTKEEQQEFEKSLAETRITQPAIVINSLIWTEFLSKLGVEPSCVGGHSLGELTAFYKAGAFGQDVLIRFAEFRGEIMSMDPSLGGMVSLLCSKQKAEELVTKVSGNIIVANINSPNQAVVSGGLKEIERIVELAAKAEISAYRLNVSNAFHSSCMKGSSEKIRSSRILPDSFRMGPTQLFSGMDHYSLDGKINLKDYFSKQVIFPVNFLNLINAISKNCDVLIEVGPGRVLTDLVKAINKTEGPLSLPVESTSRNDRDLNIVLAELFARGVSIQWEELYKMRLIKVFVPASKKKFIENQCERPLKLGNQILKNEVFLTVEKDEESKQEEVKEIINGGLPEVKVNGKDNVAELLMDLTHKITGFDRESISLNLRLLDDLNLDSIKAGELIGQAARTLGIAGQIDPSQISNNTLGQIRDRLHTLANERLSEGIVDNILKRYQNRMWVRNFVLDLKPEEILTKNVNQFKGIKNVVFVSERKEAALVEALEQEFKNAKFQRIYLDDVKRRIEKSNTIDCFIAVLPRSITQEKFDLNSLERIFERMFSIVELASSNQLTKDSFVVFVQFGSGSFGENEDLKNISSCCVKSLASTFFLERPDLRVRIIDVDESISNKMISCKVCDEIQTYEQFCAVGYDSKLTRRVVYYENSKPALYKRRNISWSSKDVVVVTAGAKGITARCALEFARVTKSRMILIGRSPMPEDKDDQNNEILQTLSQFKKEGLEVHYYSCDVTNQDDIIKLAKKVEASFGKVTAIVHGAGLNSLRRLKQTNVQEALQEAMPKVMGAVNICEAFQNQQLKLIVGITSIIGLTGMESSGWYGLANEILNLYLHQFKSQNPKIEIATIAFSVWDQIGMGAKLGSVSRLADKGIGAIPVEEGVKRFRQLIQGDSGVQQTIVAARIAGIDTWRSPFARQGNFRFIEKIEYLLPKVELIAHAQLNVKDDAYLLDHNWKGSLLFPFVFGLEAMTQAVACVLGVEAFESLKIRDINLQRPISVPQETGTRIEIHALVLDEEQKGQAPQVKVEIYSQETAYKEPHFSAVFEIVSGVKFSEKNNLKLDKESKEVIDLDIPSDIYGPILFQGKLFQCIEKVHKLFYNEKTKKGECVFTSKYGQSPEVFLKDHKKFNNRFLTGDPFFIDSMLQSMQLIVSQDACLPNYIEEIEVQTNGEVNSKQVISEIKQIDTGCYCGNINGDNTNKNLVTIKNCALKILESFPDNPKSNDLVNPCERDQSILKNLLVKYERELGIKFPHIAINHISDFIGKSKEVKHKKEAPFIIKVVQDYLRKYNKSVKASIKWNKNGKPYLKTSPVVGSHISIAHERNLILCSIGENEHAIDIETIVPRSSEDWLSLLGVQKFNILKDMTRSNRDFLGTAIWSSSETCIKVSIDSSLKDLMIERMSHNNYYILRNDNNLFVCIVVKFSRGNERLLTFLLKNYGAYNEPDLNKQLGFENKYFNFYAEYAGPQQKLLTCKKFPVVFKHGKSTSRHVNFVSYCEWIGEIREYALLPVLKQLAGVVETKEWGIATNNLTLDIKGELSAGDIVEGRIWLGNKINDNVYELYFDFSRFISDKEVELVAKATQRISWVKILDHGHAKVNMLPLFLKEVMQKMEPRRGVLDPEPFVGLHSINIFNHTKLIKDCENKKFILTELKIPTSLEESNLVGNIYFSNYSIWVGRTIDSLFYKLWPKMYTSNESNSEFVCKRFKIDHLNEAMPFDLIIVRMFLDKLYSNGLVLHSEIYLSNGKKLAVTKTFLLWVKRDKYSVPSSSEMPEELINGITKQELIYE